jgi:hypothetical protein
VTRKRRSLGASLLAQFCEQQSTDTLSRPLLVAEGTAREKTRIIETNPYLSFALQQLRRSTGPLVIFGLSLREQDAHLAAALNHDPARPVAVAIRPKPTREVRRRQACIRQLLDTDTLYFFDASTHPLGNQTLTAR